MLTNLRLADLRLTTAQQRSTCQNLPSDLYSTEAEPWRQFGALKVHETKMAGQIFGAKQRALRRKSS
jgi:hypothetical protein